MNKHENDLEVIIYLLNFYREIMVAHIKMMRGGLSPCPYMLPFREIKDCLFDIGCRIKKLELTDIYLSEAYGLFSKTAEIFRIHEKLLSLHNKKNSSYRNN